MSDGALIMSCFVIAVLLICVPVILYFKLDWFVFWFHDVMGWHRPAKGAKTWSDGLSEHSICKHCGKEIMQDSQGNWFC